MADYGIPYMGSKGSIIHKIAQVLPPAENFYDLFGGGFAVSHFMFYHKKYPNVFYNEIKSDVVDLVRDAISGKYNYNVFKPEWISRERFFKEKHSSAYIRLVWSFGNDQNSYMFGKEIEQQKRSLHQAVVFNEFDEFAKSELKINSFPESLSIRSRRLACRQIIAARTGNPQQLQQLQQLERLQQLEQFHGIHLSSKSYDEVDILPNSIIYCDPPYQGTKGYLVSFDHDKFWHWVKNKKEPVFVSEYQAPSYIKTIMAINKNTKLSLGGSIETYPEKLFGNDAAYNLVFWI